MAQVFKHNGYTVVRWDKDDWFAGLMPHHGIDKDENIGKGFDTVTGGVDPYRLPGYLAPGMNGTAVTGDDQVSAYLKNTVIHNTNSHLISSDGKIHRAGLSSFDSDATWPHTIAGTSVEGEDITDYRLNGTKYLFYTHNNSSNGDVGRYDISGGTFDDDYGSTVTTSGATLDKDVPHPMVVGSDNVLYIGNGKNLDAIDGRTDSSGEFIAAALDLPDGYVISSFAKTPGFLVIYAYVSTSDTDDPRYNTEATAFFWDYVSSSFTYDYPLPGNHVNGGFNLGQTPGCFVQGKAGDSPNTHKSSMLLFNGSEFGDVTTFDKDIPSHGGVAVTGKSVLWNSEGTIYRYGAPFKGFDNTLNIIATTSGSNSGLLRNHFGTFFVASSEDTLEQFQGDYAEGEVFTGLTQLPTSDESRYKIAFVKITYLDKVGNAGRGFKLAIQSDNSIQFGSDDTYGIAAEVVKVTDSNSASITKRSNLHYYDADENVFPEVSSALGLYVRWGQELPKDASDAPIVESVEVYMSKTAL